MLMRALLVWMVMAAAEVIHGILRIRLLNRRVGDRRARQIAVGTGSLLILGITWLTLPGSAPLNASHAFAVGPLWLAATLAFEISLGCFVFRVPWAKIGADFDLRRGGLLGFGMVVLWLSPWLMGRVHGIC